ncbi:MAG: hypothetical protein NXI10_10380 [bacterium]|nr:hypothetical protein [bacterium]
MRNLLFIASLLLLASCSSNEYEAEDQLYACLEKKAQKEGFNLDNEVEKLESAFIKAGLLKSDSGEDKIAYFKKVIEKGQISLPHGSFDTYKNVQKVFFQWSDCKNGLDDELYQGSRIKRLQDAVNESIAKGTISPVAGAQALLDQLTAEDLEHPFFRTLTLVFLASMLEKDTSYIRSIPKKLKNVPPAPVVDPKDITTIAVNDSNRLTFNGEFINPDEITVQLVPILKQFEENDEQHIRIQVKQNTTYKLFAKIHSSIEAAHQEVLNYFSQIEHKKSFKQLTEEEQNELKKKHPARVVEGKPD